VLWTVFDAAVLVAIGSSARGSVGNPAAGLPNACHTPAPFLFGTSRCC
jgi:hypothetical protein